MKRANTHLYGNRVGKVYWFVKRFGLLQLFSKTLGMLFAPLIIYLKGTHTFVAEGQAFALFYHRYNTTWANECAVEIPLARSFIDSHPGRLLEVGNVLSHYFPASWDILDKFEKGSRVINEDILSFKPRQKYVTIVSISTFEHIGYDDESDESADKIVLAYRNIVDNCLAPRGNFFMTTPINYNPHMDKIINTNAFGFESLHFLKRVSRNAWKQVSKEQALRCRYGYPFSYGNCIAIGIYERR